MADYSLELNQNTEQIYSLFNAKFFYKENHVASEVINCLVQMV